MGAIIEARPLVIHQVTGWPMHRTTPMGRFELRTTSMRIASNLLGMHVADLDCVRDARSMMGLPSCPECQPHAA